MLLQTAFFPPWRPACRCWQCREQAACLWAHSGSLSLAMPGGLLLLLTDTAPTSWWTKALLVHNPGRELSLPLGPLHFGAVGCSALNWCSVLVCVCDTSNWGEGIVYIYIAKRINIFTKLSEFSWNKWLKWLKKYQMHDTAHLTNTPFGYSEYFYRHLVQPNWKWEVLSYT